MGASVGVLEFVEVIVPFMAPRRKFIRYLLLAKRKRFYLLFDDTWVLYTSTALDVSAMSVGGTH